MTNYKLILNSKNNLHFYDIKYPDLQFYQGSFSFITGKSGCGKSTYLKLLNGLIIADKNTIFFHDMPLEDHEILAYRRKVLLIPQNVYLIKGNIKENFYFYYENRGQTCIDEDKMKMYLDICCIDKPLEENCDHLSGGERQRIFLAIFLSLAQEIILLDEPTAALDEKTSNDLMIKLKAFIQQHQLTAICVSHNQALVNKFADKIIRLGEE
ncbi:MAG: energy-coupling factor ABC transporter ATP-binding protein [Erysipelotrichaceae bacterium]|nr:energy-coupling factor ABC transporter ATP-binding protein [Erysipelotrichaceae bacterium]MDY5251961.1 ABC transporter ATP-binding protein [Erysipelotrichaceae bacterium]